MTEQRHRRALILVAVIVSLTLLAAPARGADRWSVHVGSHGIGVSFGATDWWLYGRAWSDPSWTVSYRVALLGYGEWLWIDGLGRVWRPYVAAGWRPYTQGRWVWTRLGWTWASYERWGYFPHHYGHWALTVHGWVWVPGYDYHAGNVVWVRCADWIGWYPRAPHGWSHFRHGYREGYLDGHAAGYRQGLAEGYDHGWSDARYATYVSWSHLGSVDLAAHAVPASTVRRAADSHGYLASPAAPTRNELAQRHAAPVPEVEVAIRRLEIDGRSVTAVRPEGVASSVRQHARLAVEGAPVRDVSNRAGPPAMPRPASTNQEPAQNRYRDATVGNAGRPAPGDRREIARRIDEPPRLRSPAAAGQLGPTDRAIAAPQTRRATPDPPIEAARAPWHASAPAGSRSQSAPARRPAGRAAQVSAPAPRGAVAPAAPAADQAGPSERRLTPPAVRRHLPEDDSTPRSAGSARRRPR